MIRRLFRWLLGITPADRGAPCQFCSRWVEAGQGCRAAGYVFCDEWCSDAHREATS